jgi:hypothetical protein
MPPFSESMIARSILIYPAIADIPESTWEMDGEEAEFRPLFPAKSRAKQIGNEAK